MSEDSKQELQIHCSGLQSGRDRATRSWAHIVEAIPHSMLSAATVLQCAMRSANQMARLHAHHQNLTQGTASGPQPAEQAYTSPSAAMATFPSSHCQGKRSRPPSDPFVFNQQPRRPLYSLLPLSGDTSQCDRLDGT
jgi:hypothetical protein